MKKQRRQKLRTLLNSGEEKPQNHEINHENNQILPHYDHLASPFIQSPWVVPSRAQEHSNFEPINGGNAAFIGSLVREEGHVYSLAASDGFLYSGSDSKNIRVWRKLNSVSGFKSGSGFVKAIVVSGSRIFTGHQDGKIRVWSMTINGPDESNEAVSFKRSGTIPSLKEEIKTSVNPRNFVEVSRRKRVLKIKHYDAVSCMSVVESDEILYTGSWDKTVKVWSLTNGSKFQESIEAHKDAVNTVATGFESMVFTGSADGTVKAWNREFKEKGTKHRLVRTLLKGPHAVTAIVVDSGAGFVYAGTSEGVVHVWEEEKGFEHMGVLRAHSMAVMCLAALKGVVISGGADGVVCVWRRELDGSHELGSVLEGHCGPVKCLAVEEREDGCIVHSGSLDKSIRVWNCITRHPIMP